MKKIAILLCCALIATTACNKETELAPSGLDINWYVVEDAANPIDHLRYEIYRDTGAPIFYNDTIGSQERGYDKLGNQIVYYEVLDPNYAISSNSKMIAYTETRDAEKLTAALEMMRDRVLPRLPKQLHARCYFLVDRLVPYSNYNSNYTAGVAKGMMTTVIGQLNQICSMSEDEQNRLAANILATEYAAYMFEKFDEELVPFYTYASVTGQDGSKTYTIYEYELSAYSATRDTTLPVYKSWLEYGFLDYSHNKTYTATGSYAKYTTPSMLADITQYATEVLIGNDTAFATQYATYPVILAKYAAMKALLTEVDTRLKTAL